MDLISVVAAVVGIVVGIVTLVREWPLIVSATSKLKNMAVGASLPNLRRRNFLIIASTGIVSIIAYATWPQWREVAKKGITTKYPDPNDSFVKNAKTGVIHHVEACVNHLPPNLAAVEADEIVSTKLIHTSKLPHIASIEKSSEREALVINAIKKSPTSTHLYKILVSEWGRKKEYSRIHAFLETNIEYLNVKLSMYSSDKRLLKKYTKAINDLEKRRDRAQYLAKMAKFS